MRSTAPDSPEPEHPAEAGGEALAAGTRIGRFQVQGLLGQGGMGAVYRAWDPVLERKVALKAIRLGGDGPEETLARFRREAMALAQLNHPNVCQVHDWVEAEGRAYIAMEFIEGGTLASVAGGLAFRPKLQVLRAVARALEAAHAKGIVHRDLKPGNIMVDGQGRVKVLDFGLARLADAPGDEALATGPVRVLLPGPGSDAEATTVGLPARSDPGAGLTEAGTFMGTPSHASPEQLRGQRVGPASDIFSLGLVAWELLLEGPPFPGRGLERAEAMIRGHLLPARRRLPRRLAALLRAMLRPDPAARPSAEEVARILGRQLAGFPPLAWAGGAAVLAALLVGSGYALFGRGILADLGRERPPRLVVMPFRNETEDPSLDPLVSVGMTELCATGLRASPSLTVVEPEAVDRALAGLHLAPGEAGRPAGSLRIARALGAPLVLRGSLRRAGDSLAFAYELADASGRIRLSGAARVPRGAAFEPFPLVEPALHDLLRKVDPLRSAALQEAPVTPAVFAAYATGKARFMKGDFKGSEEPLREAALQAPAFSAAVGAYAACERRLGQPQAPLAANWALMAAKATGDRWAEVRALALTAYLARDRGDLDTSQRLREASLALAQALGDTDDAIVALNHLGLIAAERGRDGEARAYFERALGLSQGAGDQLYEALIQNNLANLALKRGDLDAAGARYASTLRLQQDLGNRWGEALALNNLGVVALMARDLPRAEDLLLRSLAAREAVGDKAGQASCLRNLGILALMKGLPEASAGDHARALALAAQTGQRALEAECQFYAADLERRAGRFRQAREGYQRVLSLLAAGVTPAVRDNAQAGLAECLVRQPRPDLRQADRLLRTVGPEAADSPFVHRARAWLAFAEGNPGLARGELARALADPQRQAPEIRAELEAARARF